MSTAKTRPIKITAPVSFQNKSPSYKVRSHQRVVQHANLPTDKFTFLTPLTSQSRVIIVLDYREHKLVTALSASDVLKNNPKITWVSNNLSVGDIAVYILNDTKTRGPLKPPLHNIYPTIIFERKTYLDLIDTIKNTNRRHNISILKMTGNLNNVTCAVIFEKALKIHNGVTDIHGKIQRPNNHDERSKVHQSAILGYVNGISSRMSTLWTTTPANTLATVVSVALNALGTARSPLQRFPTIPLPIPIIKIDSDGTQQYNMKLIYQTADKRPKQTHGVTISVNRRHQKLTSDSLIMYQLEYFMTLTGDQILYCVLVEESDCNKKTILSDIDEFNECPIDSVAEYSPVRGANDSITDDECVARLKCLNINDGANGSDAPDKSVHASRQKNYDVYVGLAIKMKCFELCYTTSDISKIVSVIGGFERHHEEYILYSGVVPIHETTPQDRICIIEKLWAIAEQAIQNGNPINSFTGLTLWHILFHPGANETILAHSNDNPNGVIVGLAPNIPEITPEHWPQLLDQHKRAEEERRMFCAANNQEFKENNATLEDLIECWETRARNKFINISIAGLVLFVHILHRWPHHLEQIHALELALGNVNNKSLFLQEPQTLEDPHYVLELWLQNKDALRNDTASIAWTLNVPTQDVEPAIAATLSKLSYYLNKD